jgi:hypothetical protein
MLTLLTPNFAFLRHVQANPYTRTTNIATSRKIHH